MAGSVAELPRVDEPRVSIEMGGPNIVIRSSADIDGRYTASLASAVNAAADAHTAVVLDPDPIRCDETFSGSPLPPVEIECNEHATCSPVAVEAIGRGTIRAAAHHTWWIVDLARGRFCQVDRALDWRFVPAESWTSVVAVCVTPTRLRALTADGGLVSSVRAHAPLAQSA